MAFNPNSLYRLLPSVNEADSHLKDLGQPSGKAVRPRLTALLGELRDRISKMDDQPDESFFQDKQAVLAWLSKSLNTPSPLQFHRVINATGVVVHTNLGRSPLPKAILEDLLPLLASYSTLEFDLTTGRRGSRGGGVAERLKMLSGAEDALVVNNNAAAVYLSLLALPHTTTNGVPGEVSEVIVSRGELVEIGGSFRIPDIMAAAGVKLIEVGTTNRTRASDYANAITENTVALMKVHPSNYSIRGFTEEASPAQLVEVARSANAAREDLGKNKNRIITINDLGSGNFYRFSQPALRSMRTVQDEVGSGVDLLSFSGDKLLGGVQTGIIVGNTAQCSKLRKHPLYRAMRVDKTGLATLEAVLGAYLDPATLPEKIPTIGMLEAKQDDIGRRAKAALELLSIPQTSKWQAEVCDTTSMAGGGALPEVEIPSAMIQLSHPSQTAESVQNWLRSRSVPIIVRVQDERAGLDFRTVFDDDFAYLAESLNEMFAALP